VSEDFPSARVATIEIEVIVSHDTKHVSILNQNRSNQSRLSLLAVDSRVNFYSLLAHRAEILLGIKSCILRYYYYYSRNISYKRKGDHDRKSFRFFSRA